MATTITNATGLQNMDLDLTADYVLGGNIDCVGIGNFEPVGGWNGQDAFTGTLDGAGYTISNITVNRGSDDYIGLFGDTDGATLTDVVITGASMTGDDRVGGLVGRASDTTISGCSTAGTVSGDDYIGGLVGETSPLAVTISSSSSSANVSGGDQVGGFVGAHYIGTITSCYASGTATGSLNIGGFCGLEYAGGSVSYTGSITKCYSTGAVTVASNDNYAGGFIGTLYGAVSQCYATGTSTYTAPATKASAGGFAGLIDDTAAVADCFATGNVNAGASKEGGFAASITGGGDGSVVRCYSIGALTDAVGSTTSGFANTSSSPTVTGCFWDKTTSGEATSDAGTGHVTATMKLQSTYTNADWDFDAVWFISDSYNSGYPGLITISSDPTKTNVLFTVGPDVAPYYTSGQYLIYDNGDSEWDAYSGSRLFRVTGTGTAVGYIWIEGTELHFINANGVEVNLADSDLYVLKSLFNANTILKADADDTPEALTIAEQEVLGRLTGGEIDGISLGIADNNIAQIDGTTNSPANLDYAKFTTSGLEGKTYQELVNDISGVIKGTDVGVSELSTATYDDVQDFINFFGDRTILSGGGITAHGDNDGSVIIAACTAWCKETNSDTAVGKFFDYAGKAKQTLTDLRTNIIYLDYNGGTPQIVVGLTYTTYGFQQDHILMGVVFRQGTAVHIKKADTLGIQSMNRSHIHAVEHAGAHRASGLVTTDGGSLALSITTGITYAGHIRQATTIDGSTWSYWYTSDSGSTWAEDTGVSALVQSYNDITSGKVSLGTGKYGVHWVYVDFEGDHCHIVYGQGNYNVNQAEEAGVPGVLPPIVASYSMLIAKIVNQEGTNTMTITYPWTTVFTSSLATDHGSLGGLSDDDHTQYVLATGARAMEEIILTPKSSSSSTSEGTIFYDSDDNSVWVATE